MEQLQKRRRKQEEKEWEGWQDFEVGTREERRKKIPGRLTGIISLEITTAICIGMI